MRRVLVADDSELDIELTRRALKKALPDWEVEVIENGASVGTSLTAREQPDLVLLDFKMPGMGAAEILAAAGAAYWESVPAVIFSSSVSPTDVARCRDLGAREYVEKPTDPTEYSQAVRAICERWIRLS